MNTNTIITVMADQSLSKVPSEGQVVTQPLSRPLMIACRRPAVVTTAVTAQRAQ